MHKILKNLFLLARLDKPIGSILLLFPCWWGVAYIQKGNFSLSLLTLFLCGSVIMRSAGCVLNDFFDKDIDRNVTRTATRPLAAKTVSSTQALLFFGVLCLLGLGILLALPKDCFPLGVIGLLLLIVYPLMKRITNFPQVVLGLAFNIGFLIAVVACTERLESIYNWPVPLVYAAAILWTVAYDTVYAIQDREDDIKLGVKSTAVLFGEKARAIISLLYLFSVFFMIIVGYLRNLSLAYFLFVFLGYLYCFLKLKNLNFRDTAACREFFVSNQWLGAAIFFAFVLG